MNEDFREHIKKTIFNSFSKKSLKPIVLAYKDITNNIQIQTFENFPDDSLESNLIFIALVGIKDPLKDDVVEAISLCNYFFSISIIFI